MSEPIDLDLPSPIFKIATVEDINIIFTIMLGHGVEPHNCGSLLATGARISDVMNLIMHSSELARHVLKDPSVPDTGTIDNYIYRIPDELSITEIPLRRVLVIGSCLIESMTNVFRRHAPSAKFDFINFYNASALPYLADDILSAYDFQILQIPIRTLIPEHEYFQLKYNDDKGYQRLFDRACAHLSMNLEAILKYHREHGLLTFIMNFQAVQQNPIGRMQDRYSLKNMKYFIEELNRYIYDFVRDLHNVHVIDLDEITAMYGKKYAGEDLVFVQSHGAFLVDIESRFDGPRFEPLGSTTIHYGSRTEKYMIAVLEEAKSMLRTIQQIDAVKLVIFDLDDTLWPGVMAECAVVDAASTEGWPIGLVEAASYLWRRGVMIAIVSKNDIENVERIWSELYGSRFSLDNFVKVIANWRPKADNIAELIAEVNVLANSVLFVDDNPVERAAVKAALPGVRTLEVPLVHWRRILLWSGETQRSSLTNEAVERTQMMQAQFRREETRAHLSREDFIKTLDLEVSSFLISSNDDQRYERGFELLNKTNQFNTTGVRWTPSDAERLFDDGGYWLALSVKDVHTSYGITALLCIRGNTIEQFVLSCRVFGMDVEIAAVAIAQEEIIARGHNRITALTKETEKNKLSRDIYMRTGFTPAGDGTWDAEQKTDRPPHIRILRPAQPIPEAMRI